MEYTLEDLVTLCAARSVRREEFFALPLARGVSHERAWALIGRIHRLSGTALPFDDPDGPGPAGRDWLFETRRIGRLAQACVLYSLNSPHATSTLVAPEGRHFHANLFARECVACLRLMGLSPDAGACYDAMLGLAAPRDVAERLAANAFALWIENYATSGGVRDVEDVVELHGRLSAGLEGAGAQAPGRRCRQVLERAAGLLAQSSFSEDAAPAPLRALILFQLLAELRPFPALNALVGRMLYTDLLCRCGMHLAVCPPVVEFLVGWRTGRFARPGFRPGFALGDALVAGAGSLDWTAYFEAMLGFVADELGWMTNKLTGIALRRRRFEDILAADVRYNVRQHDVLVEAVLHEDAEFSFQQLVREHGVAYSTTHGDLEGLARDGFLRRCRTGKRHYFIAVDDVQDRVLDYARRALPEAYARYFDAEGGLREGIREQRRAGRPRARCPWRPRAAATSRGSTPCSTRRAAACCSPRPARRAHDGRRAGRLAAVEGPGGGRRSRGRAAGNRHPSCAAAARRPLASWSAPGARPRRGGGVVPFRGSNLAKERAWHLTWTP